MERDEAANETADGVGDVELGTKVALCDEDGWRPQVCVVLAGRFPTGSKDVSDRQFGASLAFSGAWDLGDGASWGALAGLSRTPDGSEDSVSGAFAVSIGRGFGDHASAYVELGVFPGFHAASSESYVGTGVAYLTSNDVQLDASCDFGLNGDSTDAQFAAGVSWRF